MKVKECMKRLFHRSHRYHKPASDDVIRIKAPAIAEREIARVRTRCGSTAAQEFRSMLESSPAQLSGHISDEDCRIYYAVLTNAYLLCREEAWRWDQLTVPEGARGA